MSHSLHRLLSEALNKPHLITESALVPIISYLTDRSFNPDFALVQTVPAKKVEKVATFGEILIDGPLTYKPVQAACAPEGCSYQRVLSEASELIDAGVETIILTHSSPGGEAQQAFSTAQSLREMCDEAGVRLVSYIDTMSASASYLIACVADIVIIHPEAQVGSIGCVLALRDMSGAMANAGIKPVFISSTKGKIPYDPDGSFSESFLEDMQEKVTKLGNQFANHVSSHTGISFEDVLATDAKMYSAEDALSIGLVNKILNHKQFALWLTESKEN